MKNLVVLCALFAFIYMGLTKGWFDSSRKGGAKQGSSKWSLSSARDALLPPKPKAPRGRGDWLQKRIAEREHALERGAYRTGGVASAPILLEAE